MKKLFFGLCAAALSVCAADIFLVRNGKAEAEIVLPEKAPGSVQLAAYELNAHIQLITIFLIAKLSLHHKQNYQILLVTL